MGGRVNIWETGKDRQLGLVDAVGQQINVKAMNFNDTSAPDDDLLEMTVFSHVLNIVAGKANRIAQEKGPFSIVFKEPTNKHIHTYF